MPSFFDPVADSAISGLIGDGGSTCAVYGPWHGTEGELDTDTGEVVYPARVELWRGPCLVQTDASDTESGGARTSEEIIRLPAGATGFRPGDLIEVDGVAGWFEIIRVPVRSLAMSVPLRVRRRIDLPGPGGS